MQKHAILFLALAATAPTAFAFGDDGPRPASTAATAAALVNKYAVRMNKVMDEIPSAVMDAIVAYDWPGNIRQLQNFVEHGVIVSTGFAFEPPLGQLQNRKGAPPKSRKTLEDATREHILQALDQTRWVVGGRHGTAAYLGIARTTLLSKMRRLGIESIREREAAFASMA